jgi:hypothetical protein
MNKEQKERTKRKARKINSKNKLFLFYKIEMIQWIFLIILIILILFVYFQNKSCNQIPKQNGLKANVFRAADKPDWLVQAEKDYGMPMTYPQAADELANLGYPQSTIEENRPIIQSNLEQIQKDNAQSLQEKINDPTADPPRYGVTIASIYSPEEFIANNTGLKLYPPQPPQSQFQPVQPSSYGKVIVPDKSKILPSLNYGLMGNIKMPVYNQNQCGCCWVVACCITLNYQLYKLKNNNLNLITFPNLYTFCIEPKPRGFSQQSNGCNGGIPTDVFIDINNSKKLSVIQNQPTNLSFNQNNNNCSTMIQPNSGNPILNVTSESFPIEGVVALYQDGKFYYNKVVNNPSTFLPTSDLRSYTGNPRQVFTPEQIDVIKYLLCVNGPMVIGFNAARANITNYKGGVVSLPAGRPDHAVTIIGYEDNKWIIQNSWSEKWGMNGIFYADMNTSYITMMTSSVLFESDLFGGGPSPSPSPSPLPSPSPSPSPSGPTGQGQPQGIVSQKKSNKKRFNRF